MAQKPPKYVIDTSSLVQLRRNYPLDLFPVVWKAMDRLADDGVLISSVEVLDELAASEVKGDDVLKWAYLHENIFMPLDGFVQQKVIEILESFETLIDIKKKKSSADPFVIATAILQSCTVVTEEQPTKNSATNGQKVKIPDVCKRYQIQHYSLLDMLRNEGIKFPG